MTNNKPIFPYPIKIITPQKEVMVIKHEKDLPEDYKILETGLQCKESVMLFLRNK
jgi:hypothetical protein